MLREEEIPEVSTSSINASDAKGSEKPSVQPPKVETTQSLFDSLFIQNACNESYSEHMNVDRSQIAAIGVCSDSSSYSI